MDFLPVLRRGHARVVAEKAAQGRLVGEIDAGDDRLQVHGRFAQQGLDFENGIVDDPVARGLAADAFDQIGQVFGRDSELCGIVGYVEIRRVLLDNQPHEAESILLLTGIFDVLFCQGIVDIDGVNVPVIDPQQLHDRFAAAVGGCILGPVVEQVAEIPEAGDQPGARFGCDVLAHVDEKVGCKPPQGAQAVGEHVERYAEEHKLEVVADLLDRYQLPGQECDDHFGYDPEPGVEHLYRRRSRRADGTESLQKVGGAIVEREVGKVRRDTKFFVGCCPEGVIGRFCVVHRYKNNQYFRKYVAFFTKSRQYLPRLYRTLFYNLPSHK